MNDFVGLLIGVTAFALCMVLGGAVLWGLENRFGTSDDLIAFGPPIRFSLSIATAVLAYRRAPTRGSAPAHDLAAPLTPP